MIKPSYQNNKENPWIPAEEKILREEWDKGKSITQIGIKLGRTRNSIAGKVRMLKLTPRPSPILPPKDPNLPVVKRSHKRKPRVLKVENTFTDSSEDINITQVIFEEYDFKVRFTLPKLPSLIDSLPIPLVNIGSSNKCQWAISNNKPWVFCCEPSLSNYSYCTDHKKLAYKGFAS